MSHPHRFPLTLALAAALLMPAALAMAGLRGSPLAMPLSGRPQAPPQILAQRSIDRQWGPSEDTTYVDLDAPEWKSEGLAAAMSAVVPGAGQVYVGEGSGYWFALVEAAGWAANRIYLHKAHSEQGRYARFAGNPADSNAAWSSARWSEATGRDAADILRLWQTDREAFYEEISHDPTYLVGWEGKSYDTKSNFREIRTLARANFSRAREAAYALWLNHLLAAFDALRAARLHNLPLQHDLELRIKSSWRGGAPDLSAALVRRF